MATGERLRFFAFEGKSEGVLNLRPGWRRVKNFFGCFLLVERSSMFKVQSSRLRVVVGDQHCIDLQKFKSLYEIGVHVKNLISGFLRYLRSQT